MFGFENTNNLINKILLFNEWSFYCKKVHADQKAKKYHCISHHMIPLFMTNITSVSIFVQEAIKIVCHSARWMQHCLHITLVNHHCIIVNNSCVEGLLLNSCENPGSFYQLWLELGFFVRSSLREAAICMLAQPVVP